MPPSVLADLKLPDPKDYASGSEAPAAAPAPGGAPTPTPVPKQNAQYLPMPASAKDAIVGKIYNTSRGPAKWDGKQFIPI